MGLKRLASSGSRSSPPGVSSPAGRDTGPASGRNHAKRSSCPLLRLKRERGDRPPGAARDGAPAQTHRRLLLIRSEGDELLARLDEGGFTHYYACRAGAGLSPWDQALVDNAWRALAPASSSCRSGLAR